MDRGSTGHFNVVGAYPNMEEARRALDALEFAGIDEGHISLEGEAVERAAYVANRATNTSDRDRPMVAHIVARAFGFAAGGVVLGALIGLFFHLLGVEVVPAVGDSIAVAVPSYAGLGLIIGALIGGYSSISQGEGWELTFQPIPERSGRILVAVRSDDPHDIERAERVLRAKYAISVAKFEGRGPRHLAS